MVLLGWGALFTGSLLILSGYLGHDPVCVLRTVVNGDGLPSRTPAKERLAHCGNTTTTSVSNNTGGGLSA